MTIYDLLWMIAIIAGALYVLYRSVWKKKGHCPGCGTGSCAPKKLDDPPGR